MNTKTLSHLVVGLTFLLGSSTLGVAAESGHSGHATGPGKPLPPGWEPAVHDSMLRTFTLLEKAEFRTGDAPDAVVVDAQGWVGGDYQRLGWKAEGEQETTGEKSGEFEVQALYGRVFSPFWDFHTGLRVDRHYRGPTRETTGYFVVGIEGLAPYWFEVAPTLFVSEKGKTTFRFTASYEQLLTQRLVVQPRLDLNMAFQDDRRRDVAAGFNDVELGLRLRYDLKRQFSPYIGVTWRRLLGATAGLGRRSRAQVSQTSVVIGLRAWF